MDELFTFNQYLIQLACRLPLIAVVVVGLIVCYQQRNRRPRAAQWMGAALVMELFLSTIGWSLYAIAMRSLGFNMSFDLSTSQDWDVVLQLTFSHLPGATIAAVVWTCALWAVLTADDVRTTESE